MLNVNKLLFRSFLSVCSVRARVHAMCLSCACKCVCAFVCAFRVK